MAEVIVTTTRFWSPNDDNDRTPTQMLTEDGVLVPDLLIDWLEELKQIHFEKSQSAHFAGDHEKEKAMRQSIFELDCAIDMIVQGVINNQ